MIAMLMVFGLVAGGLFAAAAALLEPVLLRWRRPARWLWLTAMLGSVYVLVGAVAFAPAPDERMRASQPTVAVPWMSAPPEDASAAQSIAARRAESRYALSLFSQRGLLSGERFAARRVEAAMYDRLLVVLWVVSSITLAFWLAALTFATRRALSGSQMGGPLPGTHDVIITADVGPAAMGTLRTRILLPQWVLDLEPSLRALVVQHEREHLRARDPLLLVLAMALLVLVPWMVPLWWTARRLRWAIEYDCDARVLQSYPDVRRYGSLLMLVSAQRRTSSASLPYLAHMVFMSTGSAAAALRHRILVMTQPRHTKQPIRTLISLAAAATISFAALSLPVPSREINAQTVPPAASPSTSPTRGPQRTPTDAVIAYRYAADARGPAHGPRPLIYLLQRTNLMQDPHAGFTTIHVTSKSGKPTTVALYSERSATDRTSKADTTRYRTPFSLLRISDTPVLHIRSLAGDTILISSPTAIAPVWASKIAGVHFVLWGVDNLGVVQR